MATIVLLVILLLLTISWMMFCLLKQKPFSLEWIQISTSYRDIGIKKQWIWLTVPLFILSEKVKHTNRYSTLHKKLSRKLSEAYRLDCSIQTQLTLTSIFMIRICLYSILLGWLFMLLGIILNSWDVLLLGLIVCVFVIPLQVVKLDQRVRKIKKLMIATLPEFLSSLTLLVNAGENVPKAIIRCIERKGDHPDNPLYRELLVVRSEMLNGYPLPQVLEKFSKRCSVQEVSIFTTTVLMNYRRGGEQFAIVLRELSRELWDRRKAEVRIRGEEASSKLVLPMMMIFVAVMVIVAAPAIMLLR